MNDESGRSGERMLGDATWQHFERPLHAVCITLYNEPLASLRSSLHALVHSLSQPEALGRSEGAFACVCIVVDGLERLDPAMLGFLVDSGCVDASASSDDVDTTHFLSLHAFDEWLVPPAARPLPALRVVVSLKRSNRGKLHSHALFFNSLCRRMSPSLCFQIDVGTTIAPTAIEAVVRHFERCPDAGGLATRVGCPAPRPQDGLLLRWQYMDFAVQVAANWPAELVSGHLSVVPGQFCAFRWEALAHAGRGSFNSLLHGAKGESSSPVARYLRGIRPASAMEAMMFLAEDRVIGNEIVLEPGRPWKLDYCQDAVAITDPCVTLGELQRQRRRWNNCSYACRLWLLAQWPALLRRSDRSLPYKLRLSSAMTWQSMLALLQATAPAALVCWTAVVAVAVVAACRQPEALLAQGAIATLCLAVTLSVWTPRRQVPAYAAMRDLVMLAALVLLALTLGQVMPRPGVLLLLLPGIVTAAMPVVHSPPRQAWRLLRHVPEFFLFNGPVQLLLWSYSLRYLHDTSWGTKGLVGVSKVAITRSMRRYRSRVTGTWLVLNASLIACGLLLPGWFAWQMNPGAEVVGIVGVLTAGMALVGLTLRRVIQRLPGRRDSALSPVLASVVDNTD